MSEEDNKPIVWRDGTPVQPIRDDNEGALDKLFADESEDTSNLWVSRSVVPVVEEKAEEVATFSSDYFRQSDVATELFQEEQGDDWLSLVGAEAERYIKQDTLYRYVQDILAIALSGDTSLQAVVSKFVLTRDPELDKAQKTAYSDLMQDLMPKHGIAITNPKDFDTVLSMAYDELLGIGPLGPLWRDEEIVDIMVTGPDKVTVERGGKLVRTPVRFRDRAHLQSTARRMSVLVDDRAVSRTNPIITVQLPGARVQLVWEPIATEGASVVIRKHRAQMTLDMLVKGGALNNEIVAFLADAVSAKATVLVSGATGSGKTTYLNVLSGFIPKSERVIVIEDARELHLANEQVEYLLTKSAASADDNVIFGYDKLLRASLRMRPDRIVVGEIIDALGAQAMLEASFTGHDGTMTTLHANNPTDALVRIAGLLRQATGMPEDLSRKQVNATFDLVLQVMRDPSGKRLVTHVSSVNAEDGSTQAIFRGKVSPDGNTVFERTGVVTADSELGMRMVASGVDIGPWEEL